MKVRVLVRSGWTLGTLGKPGSHPPETGGSWPSSPVKAWVCSGLACLNGCQQRAGVQIKLDLVMWRKMPSLCQTESVCVFGVFTRTRSTWMADFPSPCSVTAFRALGLIREKAGGVSGYCSRVEDGTKWLHPQARWG